MFSCLAIRHLLSFLARGYPRAASAASSAPAIRHSRRPFFVWHAEHSRGIWPGSGFRPDSQPNQTELSMLPPEFVARMWHRRPPAVRHLPSACGGPLLDPPFVVASQDAISSAVRIGQRHPDASRDTNPEIRIAGYDLKPLAKLIALRNGLPLFTSSINVCGDNLFRLHSVGAP